MEQGKILIVDVMTGSVLGWFGENHGDNPRPAIENIILLELEPHQNEGDFMNLPYGMDSIKVVDIENKILAFDNIPASIPLTLEQQQILELENQLLLMADSQAGGIL